MTSEAKNLSVIYRSFLLLKKPNKRFYHIKSVENFIFHFDETSQTLEKENIFNLLKNYLDHINENDISDIIECREKFEKFIYPVGKYFEKNCKFIIFVKLYISIFYLAVICSVLYFFNSNVYFYLCAIAAVLIFYGYTYLKIRNKRIYGFSW